METLGLYLVVSLFYGTASLAYPQESGVGVNQDPVLEIGQPVAVVEATNERTSTSARTAGERPKTDTSSSTAGSHSLQSSEGGKEHVTTTHAAAPHISSIRPTGLSSTNAPPLHTHINSPPPLGPPSSTDPASPHSHTHTRVPSTEIFGVAIGGLAGVLFCVGFFYCLIKWKRAPRRDRTAAIMSRFQLEQEMDGQARERMRAPLIRRPSLEPPPPAYEHAPEYDQALPSISIRPFT